MRTAMIMYLYHTNTIDCACNALKGNKPGQNYILQDKKTRSSSIQDPPSSALCLCEGYPIPCSFPSHSIPKSYTPYPIPHTPLSIPNQAFFPLFHHPYFPMN